MSVACLYLPQAFYKLKRTTDLVPFLIACLRRP
jgi:hypothetical protein